MQRTGGWCYRHLFTASAAAVIAVALTVVPQINHVVVQVPWFQHAAVFEVLVFWAYLAFLGVLFVGLCWFSLPRKDPDTDPLGKGEQGKAPAPGRAHGFDPPTVTFPEGPETAATARGPGRMLGRRCSQFAALLTLLVKRLDARVRIWLGAVLIVFALAWYFATPLGSGAAFALEDASRTALAMVVGLVGAWMLLFDRGRDRDTGTPHYHVAVAGRALWLMLVTYALGEVLWFCSYGYHLFATPRAYTLWALMQFAFLMVLVARSVDAVHTYSRANVRVWFVAVVAAWVCALGAEPVGGPGAVAARDVAAVDATWFDALEARLDAIPPGPAVIVTASGGGSRAALFAGLVFERLSSLSVSRDAPTSFRDHVVLISAVSGGSLASAYEVYSPPGPAARLLPGPRNSFHDELLDRMRLAARDMRGEGNVAGDGLDDALSQLERDIEAEARHETSAPRVAGDLSDDVHATVHGRFADDMATDFMAPMLRGALLPGIERGTRLCDFWRERFDWARFDNLAPHDPNRPLLLLNATDNGRGVRLAIGFPPLPRGLLGETMSSLADVAPGWRVDLAQAVRLSANFPWGLQVAVVRLGETTPEPLAWIPPTTRGYEVRHSWQLDDRSTVKILDGGIIDNTGLDTVARLFERLRRLEEEPRHAIAVDATAAPRVSEARGRALAVLAKLRARKVLLVEIDAGRKFQPGGPLSSAFPTVFAPLSSLQSAAHVNALLRKETHMSVLADVLNGDGDEARFLSVPFVCNREEDVMTAWALGSKDKASVMVQFLAESRMQGEVLQAAFRDLVEGAERTAAHAKQESIDAEAMVRQARYDVRPRLQARPDNPDLFRQVRSRSSPRGPEWKKR